MTNTIIADFSDKATGAAASQQGETADSGRRRNLSATSTRTHPMADHGLPERHGHRRLLRLGRHLSAPRPGSVDGPPRPTAGGAAAALALGRGAPFARYSDLLDALSARGHATRELGRALDGSPLVVVKCGGEKFPAVFISAGAHSTEQAGVVACVELADEVVTDHAVYILPCRDPMGLGGFRHVLGLGVGDCPALPAVAALKTTADAAAFLREQADVLHDRNGRLVATLGEAYAYSIYVLRISIETAAFSIEKRS